MWYGGVVINLMNALKLQDAMNVSSWVRALGEFDECGSIDYLIIFFKKIVSVIKKIKCLGVQKTKRYYSKFFKINQILVTNF